MRVLRRTALLGGLLCLAVATAGAGTTIAAAVAPPTRGATIEVHGTLWVAQSDGPTGGSTSYAVALADGDLVPVRGTFAPGTRTGATFSGRLALPATVSRALALRTGAADQTRAALRIVDRRSLTLSVVGTPTVIAPAAPAAAATSTAHQQFVAALDNKGALGQDDPTLLGHVSAVGAYWKAESNGAISSIGVPSTVAHYDTALATTDCGLGGDDFYAVVNEAAAQFPGFDIGAGDQLVLFVPGACQSGGIVGEGTVGGSFASGGALVVKAGSAIEGTYAHETGHNYGFAHANARWSGTSLEYYGIYDVMGFALSGVNQLTALSTPYRVFQGITDPGEIQNVDLGTKTLKVHVNATLEPRSDDAGLRSIRVVDPHTGEALYLDYRSGTGQDAGSAYLARWALGATEGNVRYAPGVTINALRDGSGVDTFVLDGSGDTSLGAGDTWTDAAGTLSVHVSTLTPTGADVSVRFTPPVLSAARPTIGGKPVVGRKLKAVPGTWTTGTALTYAWYADGVAIKHATTRTLVLARAQKGKRITVKVTGRHAGYQSRTVASAHTARVT